MSGELIYLDNAATTPVDTDALAAAIPYFCNEFYNPASSHAGGQRARAAVERAREQCAGAIGASAEEIYFTSGGTEAVNWALSYVKNSGKSKLVISSIEHDCAIEYAKKLEREGIEVVYVRPNADGIITPGALRTVMDNNVALVCVMTVNNIVGSIQPIKELSAVAHEYGALMFTDAVQAMNTCAVNVNESGADMLAVSGHKLYAPKGVGFLYVRRGVKLTPMLLGGAQENNMRAGTVNVPAAVALGYAAQKAVEQRERYVQLTGMAKHAFLTGIADVGTPVLSDNGTDIACVVFPGVNGGRLAVALSCAGVCCSVGAACAAGSALPPATLTEMGVKNADCAVRFSFGRYTMAVHAIEAAQIVKATVQKLKV